MTENEKVVRRGVEDIAVRAWRGDGLDRFECFRVEKRRRIADDQAGVVFRVDRDAMPRRVGQGARKLVGIEIEYTDRIAAGDVDPAVNAVRRDVVNPPGGGNLCGGKYLVGLGRAVVGRCDLGENQKRRDAEGGGKHCARLLKKLFHTILPGCQGTFGC
jgi:hypothetical protein